MFLLSLIDPVSAFCGTYVGQAGASLYNHASQVAVARKGGHTTLTLANDYSGELSGFALLVPVPEVLGPDDVQVVSPDLLKRVDEYSGPRVVSYSCDDFAGEDEDSTNDTGAAGGGGSGGGATGVTVEAEFTEGEYTISILSATESGALLDWLEANEYAVDANAAELLQEYIEAGSYFFAAKVNLAAVPEGQAWLSPLQFGYDSDVFSLPIRLGTLNAEDEQDLILYVLSDQGQTHISNYPEAAVEDECMFDTVANPDFGEFYKARFKEGLEKVERPGWVLEYGFTSYHCDPCTSEPLEDVDVQALGFEGTAADAYFSRIHMRYPPADVDQDLVLYGSNVFDNTQIRYIQHRPELEEFFPICGLGMASDPGSCDGEEPAGDDTAPPSVDGDPVITPEARFGCSALGSSAALGLALAGLGLARRRARVD